MTVVTVGRWGNNLAVRIPGDVARSAGIRDGERVCIETSDNGLVIRPVATPVTLEQLFAGRSAAQWRAAYAGAFDWGADVGREIIAK